jgi:urease accessory protein
VTELVTAPPLAAKLKRCDDGWRLHLVGSAASLLEGDEVSIEVHVGAGDSLAVRSAAAVMVHPCPGGRWARVSIRATVGDGGFLAWLVEPTIVAAGGRLKVTTDIAVAQHGRLMWRDEFQLGRCGEPATAATAVTRLDIERDGRPVLRDGLDTTRPGAHGPAVVGTARAISTTVLVADAVEPPPGFAALAAHGAVERWLGAELADHSGRPEHGAHARHRGCAWAR